MSIDELGTSILMWLQGNLPSIAALIAATFAVLGILSALEAILKTRTAQGAVAWSIVLVGLPIVFVPLYWIFGRRKFRGYAIAKRGDTGAIEFISAAYEPTTNSWVAVRRFAAQTSRTPARLACGSHDLGRRVGQRGPP